MRIALVDLVDQARVVIAHVIYSDTDWPHGSRSRRRRRQKALASCSANGFRGKPARKASLFENDCIDLELLVSSLAAVVTIAVVHFCFAFSQRPANPMG